MSESTTIVKGKNISLTALVFIDRECRLIFRFLAVVCFEVEVERIFLSEKNDGKGLARTVLFW